MEENQIILDSEKEGSLNLVIASPGKRFLNYLLDIVAVYILVAIASVIYYSLNPPTLSDLESLEGSLWPNLIGIVVFLIYYIGTEFGLKGKTVGKYLTKTLVVDEEGHPPTVGKVVGRTFSRFVPFEAFTGFMSDGMWHDKWTNTMVIDEKQSHIPFENQVY